MTSTFRLHDYLGTRALYARMARIAIPLGYLAGLVFHWPAFWIYTFLKIDQIIKCVWCFFRLKSGKWMKKIYSA